MRKPRQILDQRLKAFFIIFDEKVPDKSLPFIVGAMKQYAEEYHQSELLKLNKSDVISSLDLNELERKLDDALTKETTESLNEWLNEKRQ